ncbi:MAG: aldo/keto reductase [Clostridia bacterium]
MKKSILGRTGMEVTELCFGALPMGPLQKNLSIEECTEIVVAALEKGINFIDTAQVYRVYESIGRALQRVEQRPIIATKSAARTYEDMQQAVEEALEMMGIEYIDIFHLHGSRNGVEIFDTHKEALRCLLDNKKKGIIKAVGISTHSAAVTKVASEREEIDVVFPIINIKGKGIMDGSITEMQDAIAACAEKEKGVYLMKVLAGGSLVSDYHKALSFARSISGYASIALGMVSVQEVKYNVDYFNAEDVDTVKLPSIKEFKKEFKVIKHICKNCGTCVITCPNKAITIKENVAVIQQDACLQCGYCVGACKEFAIRMV